MGGLFLRLRTWWETADRTQKAVTLFGGAFLGILLLGTFYFASKPRLQPAFTGMSYADMGRVEDEVKKLGIPYEITGDGIFCLPADKIPEVKARLAVAGKLPTTGTQTDFMGQGSAFEPKNLQEERQRARLESEIAESIKFFEGVESVKVKIAPENSSPFADDKKPATASVTILEQAGANLVGEPARAIAKLVAYSTPGVDTNHVTIANQQGKMLWDGGSEDSAGGLAAKKLSAEIAEGKRRERELQNLLDRSFGPGTTIATVNVVLDFDQKQVTEITPTVTDTPLKEEKLLETMNGAAKPSAGGNADRLGAPQTPGNGQSAASAYSNEHSQKDYGNGTKQTYDQPSPGSLLSMNVTVLGDSAKLQDQEDLLRQTVEGYIGPNLKDAAHFGSTVKLVKFDTTGAEAAKKSAAAGAMGDKIQQAISILPIVALLLVGFMVVKAISKAAKDQTVLVQALPDGRMMPMSAPLSLAASSVASSSEGASAQEQSLMPALKKAKPEIGEIPDNVNVPLEQIKKMTIERPEAVAMLIKSWLLEDRR